MEFKIKNHQNTLESASGHYESIYWEFVKLFPPEKESLENVTAVS